MRSALALLVALALVGCGGSVEVSASGAAGNASAGAGSPDGAAGSGFSEAGSPPEQSTGGRPPVASDPVPDAGDSGEPGGAAGGHFGPSFVGTGGAAGSTAITRTVVDAPLASRGILSGLQYQADADSPTVYTIDALFETTRGQWDGCTQVRLDECWYYDCPPGSVAYLPSVPLQNAGAVSLTTASQPSTTVAVGLLYEYWYEANGTAELWPTSGRALTFAATGSTVPAFSLGVLSPPTVTLTSLNGEAAPTVIERSQGAELRWTSSGSGVAYFSLYGFYERKFAAVCEFDAAAHMGKLPAVLLQELEPGSEYRMIFHGTSRSHATVDGWQLDASLAGYGGSNQPYDPPVVALR